MRFGGNFRLAAKLYEKLFDGQRVNEHDGLVAVVSDRRSPFQGVRHDVVHFLPSPKIPKFARFPKNSSRRPPEYDFCWIGVR
jgi:hypothetical protein